MKIYTKQGDQGQTALFGGDRVSKHSIRIETYGTVDELNSILGVAIANEHQPFTGEVIDEVQHQLFILGADLATPFHSDARIDRISEQEVQYLEQKIDFMEESLPPLKNFILPSGSMTGATLHHARTVCRRAERLAVVCSNQAYAVPIPVYVTFCRNNNVAITCRQGKVQGDMSVGVMVSTQYANSNFGVTLQKTINDPADRADSDLSDLV